MKRTLLTTAFAFVLFTASIPVNAQILFEIKPEETFEMDDAFMAMLQTNPELIYDEYSNVLNIQEVSLEDSILNECAEAYEYNTDGTLLQELDCEVTLNKIEVQSNAATLNSVQENTSSFYVLTATASSKTSDDSLTSDGVTLYGCIGWDDNFGVINTFNYASGSRSGSYTGTGYYLAMRGTGTLCSGDFDTSFYATSNESDSSGTQFRLIVRSSTSSGTTVQLNFTTSIFD